MKYNPFFSAVFNMMLILMILLCLETRASMLTLSLLFNAIETSDICKVCEFAWPDTANQRFNNTYPLKRAIELGNYVIVKVLLSAGAEINPRLGSAEPPPLFLACRLENCKDNRKDAAVPIVKLLLDSGADSNAIADDEDLFGHCILTGAREVALYLLDRPDVRVDVNRRIGGDGLTPLEYCSIAREFFILQAIVEKGNLDLNAVDELGRTPLFLADTDLTGGVAKAMLAKGADVKHQTPSGLTALHSALKGGNEEMITILLENGADPNASGPKILPPALYILDIIQRERDFNKLDCLRILLRKADTNLPFGDGTIMDEIVRRISSSTRDKDILKYAPVLTDLLETGRLQPARLEGFDIFASTAIYSTFEEYFYDIFKPLLVRTSKKCFFLPKMSLKQTIRVWQEYFYDHFCALAMTFYEFYNEMRVPKTNESLLETKLFEFYYDERREIFAKSYFGKIPFEMVQSIWMDGMNPDLIKKCHRISMTLRVIAIMRNHLGFGEITDEHLRTFLEDLVSEIVPKLKDDSMNGADLGMMNGADLGI